MTRFADPQRCPDCHAPLPRDAQACPQCGLGLEGPLAARLFAVLTEADELLARIRAGATVGPAPVAAARPTAPAAPPAGPAPAPRRGLSAASVPQILLGLGATCLLVAAIVFLVVTWSILGVAGRTGVLVGLTLVAAAVTAWLARRRLRAAAESLAVVALGLLTLDLLGAHDAGWMGGIDTDALLVVAGGAVAAVAATAAVVVRRAGLPTLQSAEVVATLATATAVVGLVVTQWLAFELSLVVATVLAGGVAGAAWLLRLRTFAIGALPIVAVSWLILVGTGWERVLAYPSWRGLWWEGHAWPLLAAAVLAGTVAVLPLLPLAGRFAGLALAELVVAAVALGPVTDEGFRASVLALVALLAVTTGLVWSTARVRAELGRALMVTPALAALGCAAVTLALTLAAAERLAEAAVPAWASGPGLRLAPATGDARDAWLLPLTVLGVVAVLLTATLREPALRRATYRATPPARWFPAAVVVSAATAVGALTSTAPPVWVLLALLLVPALALTGYAISLGDAAPPVGVAALLVPALAIGLGAQWLTLAVLATAALASAALTLYAAGRVAPAVASAVLPVALGATTWTVGAVVGESTQVAAWTALLGIVLVGGVALLPHGRRPLGLLLPASALATSLGLLVLGLEDLAVSLQATWAAGYLTAMGSLVTAAALLHPARRREAWAGGLLLAMASWVRLADLGVEAPEAYTVPSATALALVGLHHLRRDSGARTTPALSAALALGLVPSLLWVLADPVSWRSVLLGAVCLALVLVGSRLHWSAPIVFGATVGLLLVLRHLTPVMEAVPRWALIGAAGTLLVALGITWEKRLQEARGVVGYVRTLR